VESEPEFSLFLPDPNPEWSFNYAEKPEPESRSSANGKCIVVVAFVGGTHRLRKHFGIFSAVV